MGTESCGAIDGCDCERCESLRRAAKTARQQALDTLHRAERERREAAARDPDQYADDDACEQEEVSE